MSKADTLATNKKAYHNYHILETYEAGMVLLGTEVKSMREGLVDVKESYVRVENGEAWLMGAHVQPYSHGNYANHAPVRPRKLLLHKREIERLMGKVQEKGLTLVPTRIYLKGGRIKCEIGLAKGKHLHDKREDIKKREAKREIDRAIKDSRQG